MPVIVDSNVILDVINDDPLWADWSDAQMTKYQPHGLLVNPLIYAELCAGASATSEVDEVLTQLKLEYRELSREALYLAAQAFLQYRKRGGTKSAPLPDFFIGAHAQVLDIPILTRDQGRYKTYFPAVRLVCP
jgi:predicted nucleic acid-binding protein